MKKIDFPVGISDFSKIRENEYYYIDKTGLICEVLKNPGTEVTLITRPRRFGKTLGMSMLAEFFDIEKDSRKIFQGLEISNHEKLCHAWQNQRPTVFLTFKNVDGLSFDSAYGQLKYEIGRLYEEYAYLLDGEHISDNERQIYERIRKQAAGEVEVTRSLQLLLQLMNKYYGKQAILLLDEYDVPLAKASSHGYYEQMLEVIKAMMTTTLKDNAALCFSIVTGCFRISKESIFTGTNNFVLDTITDARLDEYFGFTQKDVDKILSDAGVTEYAGQVKEWYDGYHFGECDVYCPWDVMNYCDTLLDELNAQPENYWVNTSSNDAVRKFIEECDNGTTKREIERLIAGETIEKEIYQELTYQDMYTSIDHIWSVLFTTGYLTQKGKIEGNRYKLAIPNLEIRSIYTSQIMTLFQENVKKDGQLLTQFCDALNQGNTSEVENCLNRYLRKTISIRDTFVKKQLKENFYHGILVGILGLKDYWGITSNRETGDGYSDIVVETENSQKGIILEVKYAHDGNLEAASQKAVEQIEKTNYAQELQDEGIDTILKYGIAFYKKRCKVELKK